MVGQQRRQAGTLIRCGQWGEISTTTTPIHTEQILNRHWIWQVVSSGKGSLHQGPDHLPPRYCPHSSAMGMGDLGLTCPGWHSHAAGVCQSQAVSPASRIHTVDVGGTPDYPGDQWEKIRLIGWPQCPQESSADPQLPLQLPSYHISCSKLICNYFNAQSSKKGWKETSFAVANLLLLDLLHHLL